MFGRKRKLLEADLNKPIPSSPLPPPPPEEKRSYYAKGKEAIQASKEAIDIWDKKAQEVFDTWQSPDPEYKIVQECSGAFVIQKREITAATKDPWNRGFTGLYFGEPLYPWADEIEADTDFTPDTRYETILNYDMPSLKVYSRYDSGGTYHNGYHELRFNIFQDAEDYLQRMVMAPKEKEVGYDFPPLTRRTPEITS